MICFTNPYIRDRTKAFLNGKSIDQDLVESLNLISKVGVNIGIMACNTAHVNFSEIESLVNYNLLNIIDETADYLDDNYAGYYKIGLLATDGTLKSKIYHRALADRGFKAVSPSKSDQLKIMDAIYGSKGIKVGEYKFNAKIIKEVIKNFNNEGIEIVLLACTELSLLNIYDENIVDPLDIVTNKIIDIAY